MVSAWRRLLVGAGMVLLGATLTGCNAEGTFDIISEDRVAVDLIVSGEDVDCPNAVDALKLTITTTRDASGQRACHVTGETQATYFSPFGITVSRAAEYLVLQANLSGGRDDWPTADIQIRFPGQVVSATRGQPLGNTVRITDLGDLAQGSGLRAVAIDRAGPPDWVIAAFVGTGSGALLALGVVALVRQLRRRRAVAAGTIALAPTEPVGSEPGEPAPPPGHAAAPSGLVPRTMHGIGRPLLSTPAGPPGEAPAGSQETPDAVPEEPVDHSWFARPPVEPPGQRDPARPVRAPGEPVAPESAETPPDPVPDHSAWAPPEEGS